ncbi:MAG TPA: hypothetical protein VE734_03245 [Terriglobales bacterium]|jgi:hypothetical protein|nr:hypothetical protein [Terriglobales bacterium]
MKPKILIVVFFFALLAHAKDQKIYESGMLLQMESVECGADQKSGKSFAGEILGTDSAHQKTHVLLCPEYVLQSDQVLYRIRPKDEKHPVLLPVKTKAQFRLDKDKLKLRVEDLDDKERDYVVVSMTPRESGSQTASTH